MLDVVSKDAQKAKLYMQRTKCPVCGEIFFCDSSMWGYKIFDGHLRTVCSYHCMRKVEREKAAKAAARAAKTEENKRKTTQSDMERKKLKTKEKWEGILMRIDWKRPDVDPKTGEILRLNDIHRGLVSAGVVDTIEAARAYVRKKVPEEGYYQERIMRSLALRAEQEGLPHKVWKAAQGSYSQGGVSDVLAIIGGVFFAVEVKRPIFGRTSALQERFIDDVKEAGGVGCVAIYPEDLDEIWAQAAEIRKKMGTDCHVAAFGGSSQ